MPAARRGFSQLSGIVAELVLIALFVLTYFGVRGATQGRAEVAFANARALERIEATAGIAWEDALQGLIIGHDSLVTLANWIYIYGHWPVIAAAAIFLYTRRRPHYHLLRNAMLISAAMGFVFFAAIPVAPPRYVDPSLVDTVTERSESYRALQPPALTNQYAALPSLHAGWNLLVGIVLFYASRALAVRVFAVVMPVMMAFGVVATANHYVLDVVVGVAVVLVGLAIAAWFRARTQASDDVGEGARRIAGLVRPVEAREPVRTQAGHRRRPVERRAEGVGLRLSR